MIFDILMSEYLDRHYPERRIKRRSTRIARKARAGKETISVERADGPGGQEKLLKQDTESAQEPRVRGAEMIGPGGIRRSAERDSGKRSRHIPLAVRDEVYVRDGGRCTFIGTNGRRCEETKHLQVDHIVPFAKGGANSTENLRLLCFKHNQLAAEREFGEDHMKKYSRRE